MSMGSGKVCTSSPVAVGRRLDKGSLGQKAVLDIQWLRQGPHLLSGFTKSSGQTISIPSLSVAAGQAPCAIIVLAIAQKQQNVPSRAASKLRSPYLKYNERSVLWQEIPGSLINRSRTSPPPPPPPAIKPPNSIQPDDYAESGSRQGVTAGGVIPKDSQPDGYARSSSSETLLQLTLKAASPTSIQRSAGHPLLSCNQSQKPSAQKSESLKGLSCGSTSQNDSSEAAGRPSAANKPPDSIQHDDCAGSGSRQVAPAVDPTDGQLHGPDDCARSSSKKPSEQSILKAISLRTMQHSAGGDILGSPDPN